MQQRIGAYVVNVLILIIPIFFIYNAFNFSSYLKMYKVIDNSGLDVFSIIIEILCPTYILILYVSQSAIILPLIGLCLLIIMDTILTFLFQGDLGKRIYKLKIKSCSEKKITLMKSFIRTMIKYVTIAVIPIALIYPFVNNHKMAIHDKVSGTKVVSAQ